MNLEQWLVTKIDLAEIDVHTYIVQYTHIVFILGGKIIHLTLR